MLNLNKKLIILVVIIVIGLGGILIYQKILLTPEKVVSSMMKKMANVKTVHYKADLNSSDMKTSSGQPFSSVNLSLEGDIDSKDENDSKLTSFINGSVGAEGMELSFDTEIRFVDDVLYYIFKKVPNIPIGIDFSLIKDKWIKQEALQQDKKELTAEEKDKIKKLTENAKLFSKIESLKSEKVNGVSCYKYKTTIDKKALVDYFDELSKISGGEGVFDKESFRKFLDDNLVGNIEQTIWIGKGDRLLHKTQGVISFKNETSGNIGLNLTLVLSKFNKDVKIEAPSDAQTIQELMSSYYNIPYQTYPGTLPLE